MKGAATFRRVPTEVFPRSINRNHGGERFACGKSNLGGVARRQTTNVPGASRRPLHLHHHLVLEPIISAGGTDRDTVTRSRNTPESAVTIDGDLEGATDLAHSGVAQATYAFDEYRNGDTLD